MVLRDGCGPRAVSLTPIIRMLDLTFRLEDIGNCFVRTLCYLVVKWKCKSFGRLWKQISKSIQYFMDSISRTNKAGTIIDQNMEVFESMSGTLWWTIDSTRSTPRYRGSRVPSFSDWKPHCHRMWDCITTLLSLAGTCTCHHACCTCFQAKTLTTDACQ